MHSGAEGGLNFIRLATPTTDDKRLPAVLENTSGFVYYVSMTGITGSALTDTSKVAQAVQRIKGHTDPAHRRRLRRQDGGAGESHRPIGGCGGGRLGHCAADRLNLDKDGKRRAGDG